MISRVRRSFCVLIGLVMVLACIGGTAYGQRRGTGERCPCEARPLKKAAKGKVKRSRHKRKRARYARTIRTVVVPPRDPNKFTILSTTEPLPTYRGPVLLEPDPSAGPPSSLTAVPKQISGGVLNGKAITLPKPAYPPAARAVRASGPVSVQVLIDENGDVISASAVSGNPLLRAASVQAARGAKFPPTRLSGQPVKVSGVIVYNFVP